MSDLRGSGEIEDCADYIISIDRPGRVEGRNKGAGDTTMRLECLKNRHGPEGSWLLDWRGETMTTTPREVRSTAYTQQHGEDTF